MAAAVDAYKAVLPALAPPKQPASLTSPAPDPARTTSRPGWLGNNFPPIPDRAPDRVVKEPFIRRLDNEGLS